MIIIRMHHVPYLSGTVFYLLGTDDFICTHTASLIFWGPSLTYWGLMIIIRTHHIHYLLGADSYPYAQCPLPSGDKVLTGDGLLSVQTVSLTYWGQIIIRAQCPLYIGDR